jgi:uncharacterized protein (DUF362 family)
MAPHPIYSKDASVFLVSGADKLDAFRRAAAQSGFIANLLAQWQASGKAREDFRIAIKPNIMTASLRKANSPVYTDPELVEDLIRLMRAEGFTQFSVVEAQNVYNYSYTGRRVPEVAAMCGYSGMGYEVIDLTEDTVPYDYGGALGQHRVGRTWAEADYRISFAKNKTHWQCYYTACLKNIYGCLPEWDKMLHYHGRDIEFYQATILILDRFPVHFGFLDAWISGDGLTGHVRDANPNHTRAIFASENIYALDWVAGEKMQIDPPTNPVIREAMAMWGTIHITRVGDMTTWHPWDNVRPFTVKALDVIEENYWLSRILSRSAAAEMDPRFPHVSRWQWLFIIPQTLLRVIDGLLVKQTDPEVELWRKYWSPAPSDTPTAI